MHYHYFTLEQRDVLQGIMSALPEAQRQALPQLPGLSFGGTAPI